MFQILVTLTKASMQRSLSVFDASEKKLIKMDTSWVTNEELISFVFIYIVLGATFNKIY